MTHAHSCGLRSPLTCLRVRRFCNAQHARSGIAETSPSNRGARGPSILPCVAAVGRSSYPANSSAGAEVAEVFVVAPGVFGSVVSVFVVSVLVIRRRLPC
ncbi:Uncharacterised protein [Mycobacteroides abscessus subsp. abscessus]|nr:Uncharacterised protein [Mycobacteroides abscessus subsp. abscessus]